MKRLIAALLLLGITVGCQTAAKTVYGIKKPKLETEHSVKNYLVKKKIDTANVLVYKDLASFLTASQLDLMAIPEALFFNGKGNLVRYKKETETCNAHVDGFIKDLEKFSSLEEDKSITMDKLFTLLEGPKSSKNADINVFITWTVYAGRLNKSKAFDWVRLLEIAKSEGLNVNYYLLNCDFQESWNMSKETREKLGIKD